MQHNWWIAALEYFGLITREEAEHISGEIRNTIHPERYIDAFSELESILQRRKHVPLTALDRLQSKVTELEMKVSKLETPVVPKNKV